MVIAAQTKKTTQPSKDDDNKSYGNSGTMIVDATCAPSQIKHPMDTELLNEARENTEAMIDKMHTPGKTKKPRTYRQRAHKDYLSLVRTRKQEQRRFAKPLENSSIIFYAI